jgi:trehalose 6-phosphate phosphatase
VTRTTSSADELIAAMGHRLDGRPFVVMLDVDGTLAPIAPRPEDARVPAETRAVIQRLASAADVHVALVSGRAADDAMTLVGVENLWALGNHGIELRTPEGMVEADAAVQPFEQGIANAARELESIAGGVDGALVEDKRWTVSLHYRLADQVKVPALLDRARTVAEKAGLRVTDGKKVMEVRPPVAIDKGTASVRLASRLGAFAPGGACLFAGDDRTDEDAFRALRDQSSEAVTIRVGVTETAAEFCVDDTDAFRDLLSAIATRRGR